MNAISKRISRDSALRTAGHDWKLLIDGQWVAALGSERIDVRDPSTGEVIGTVPAGKAADIDAAVAAARRAFDNEVWMRLGARERSKRMLRVAELLERDIRKIEELEILNNGMPAATAVGMAAYAIEGFRYFAGWCDKISGQTFDIRKGDSRFAAHTRKEPVGVAGLIVPWNGPISVAGMKTAVALAAGCTCVLKPSEETPFSALLLGEILLEAGIPAGVVNIVTGYGHEAGAALSEHPDVNKISFTGSTEVGKKIIQASANTLKTVTLELGGKSPVVIFDDADLSKAIPGAAYGTFHNTGQVCIAGTRVFVQRSIYEQTVEGIHAFGKAMRIGNGFEGEVDMGPLISQTQLDRVQTMVNAGRADGAEVLGGQRIDRPGYFFEPSVIVNAPMDSTVIRDEIFGPVLNVIPFDDAEEAMTMANDTSYGLASAVWTQSLNKAKMFEEKVQAGTVWINCQLILDLSVPFGGYKQSGLGREYGWDGIESFLQTKSVFTAL